MRVILSLATLLGCAAVVCAATLDEALLRDLADDAALVRERAFRRLQQVETLDEEALGRALERGPEAARPMLLELVASRHLRGLEKIVLVQARSDDPVVAEAAVRALASFGEDTVERVAGALGKAAAEQPQLAARVIRLRALAVQRAVEQDLLSRWRRKGGSYDGRFLPLRRHGWSAQPVLLAMLLDVPLEERFVILPKARSELAKTYQRMLALAELAASQRRGYRTFEPLPDGVHHADVFDLAAQALMDIGDMDLMGQILEDLAVALRRADERAGFQLRPVEMMYAGTLEEILAAHGRTELMEAEVERLAQGVADLRVWVARARGEQRTTVLQRLSQDLIRLARVLHRMRDYERAAEAYAEAIRLAHQIGGEIPAITAYNRACALARAGRSEEALVQLDTALSADRTDLTREWVTEDGDLHSLHADPRFAEIVKKHFGE